MREVRVLKNESEACGESPNRLNTTLWIRKSSWWAANQTRKNPCNGPIYKRGTAP